MKRMKKLGLLLILALAFLLTSCGGNGGSAGNGTQDDASAASEDAQTAEDSTVATPDDSTTADFTTLTPGKLTIVTSPDWPPYEFLDDSGKVTGIEMDIMSLIAEKLGLELVIDEMDFDSALLAIQQGKSDMIVSGCTILESRKLVMNFTDSYTTAVQVIIVPEGSDITLDNLGGQSIGTQRGTTGFLACVDDFGEDHVIGYDSALTAVQALLNGQVDCVVMDDSVARAYVAANAGLSIVDTEYMVEDYAFGVAKDNTALTEAVNNALNELMDDGTVQRIIDEYITE